MGAASCDDWLEGGIFRGISLDQEVGRGAVGHHRISPHSPDCFSCIGTGLKSAFHKQGAVEINILQNGDVYCK